MRSGTTETERNESSLSLGGNLRSPKVVNVLKGELEVTMRVSLFGVVSLRVFR